MAILVERRKSNPLRNRSLEELQNDVREFHKRVGLESTVDVELLIRGAQIAWDPLSLTDRAVPGITAPERVALDKEQHAGKSWWYPDIFLQTNDLVVTIMVTACAAITQGWQQSTLNSSSSRWQADLGPDDNNLILIGLINAAPWLLGSIIGAFLSDPIQEGKFGRRPALFVAAIFCAACVIGTARSRTWQQLLACRVLLGIGIGTKASIAPVFAAEAATDRFRGRVLMMWQLFDTLGIFLGFACDFIVDYSWRVLLGTAMIPPIILLFLVFICPESPRFLIRQGLYAEAFASLRRLRGTDIQAARDLYYIHSQLQVETELWESGQPSEWYHQEVYQRWLKSTTFLKRIWYLFAKPRGRRACLCAFLVMAAQQSCGINVLAFYSSMVFSSTVNSTFNEPLLFEVRISWLNFGFGLANFIFTLPAYSYIDHRGRRILFLISLGGMTVIMLAISLFFMINPDLAREGLVITFTIGFFTLFYSIGCGPIPFTFSAEVFPLALRELGMSFSVMVNFLLLGVLVMFTPWLASHIGETNFLLMFFGLNFVTLILVFLFIPETKEVSLEEMDWIFNKPITEHVKEHVRACIPPLRPRDELPDHIHVHSSLEITDNELVKERCNACRLCI